MPYFVRQLLIIFAVVFTLWLLVVLALGVGGTVTEEGGRLDAIATPTPNPGGKP